MRSGSGNPLPAHSAWRYFEEIEPPAFGMKTTTRAAVFWNYWKSEAVQTARCDLAAFSLQSVTRCVRP